MWWQEAWVWVVLGLVMGGLEMLLPGFFLLGFAAGSVLVGGLIWLRVLGESLAMLLLVLAVAAVAVWLIARKLAGVRPGQTRLWDRDINEN